MKWKDRASKGLFILNFISGLGNALAFIFGDTPFKFINLGFVGVGVAMCFLIIEWNEEGDC